MSRMAGEKFKEASEDYFKDAVERHGFLNIDQGGDANYLNERYKKDTEGLDKDIAF